jgi:methylglutaconyl-CoA hydratase
MEALLVEHPATGVSLLRLNRVAQRNALDAALVSALRAALAAAGSDPDCRVLLLAGAGPVFCAGADLAAMHRLSEAEPAENDRDAQGLAALLLELHLFAKPTIALVHGAALGGGAGLAAACDITLAARGTRFRFPEVQLGLIPAVISPYIVTAMGTRAARRYFLTGEWLSDAVAVRVGLVHECVPPDELLSTALAMASGICAGGPVALSACKQLLQDLGGRWPGPELARLTASRLSTIRSGAEARARLAALLHSS